MKRSLVAFVLLLALLFACRSANAQTRLKDGDYVAIIGDSITEQRLYSLYIEDYLLMCRPALDLRATQFGWGGETAPGFARRMANDCLRFSPTVASTCFGMNDGGYSPMDRGKAQRYRDGQKSIVDQLKKANVRVIVVGSPGVVDADTYGRNNPPAAAMYNKTLAEERDIAKALAEQEGVVFANVFDPMMDVMTKAKAKYGRRYHLAGGDGVHPDRNGHLVMAYAFLKALGCDGNIGTITINLADGKTEATDGHKVVSFQDGSAEIESTRYPFCFYGDPASPSSTRGVIEFFPFNDDLNRFKLIVTGLKGDKATVTWGNAGKEFAASDLAKGINLAAEFLDNPFSDAFRAVEQRIADQQQMEVDLIKTAIHDLPVYKRLLPDESQTLDRLAATLLAKDKQSRDASAEAVKPVRHTIRVK